VNIDLARAEEGAGASRERGACGARSSSGFARVIVVGDGEEGREEEGEGGEEAERDEGERNRRTSASPARAPALLTRSFDASGTGSGFLSIAFALPLSLGLAHSATPA
jgi:hypothetical protein